MADFSGIAAFGEGALRGYDKTLSNYRAIAEMARQREAARRAEQNQQLQTLLHGTKLAQEAPEVAELAAREPDRYGLSPETIGPGVAQTRALQSAQARLNQALANGDLEALNDPSVARLIQEPQLKTIREIQNRKKVDAIMSDPNLDYQQKAQALIRAGVDVKGEMLDRAFPQFLGAGAEATAAGTARGQMPLAESLSRAKAVGQASGELQFAGPLAGARRSAEIKADLSPDVAQGIPVGGTNVGRRALEQETPSDRARKLREPRGTEPGPKDYSVVLGRNRSQARQEVEQHLRTTSKMFQAMPPADRAIILDYYTAVKQNQLLSQDPGWEGRPLPVIPEKSPVVVKFEAEGQPGEGWLSGLKTFFMGESEPTAPITQATTTPRTLRTPAAPAVPTAPGVSLSPEVSAQIISARGAKEGDTVTQKSTGKVYKVQNGILVAQ